ncbi:MAG: YerC/YecD family TrpR-related protein [Candidatus Berkelbacteria bacterium]
MKRKLEPQLETPAAIDLYQALAVIETRSEISAFLRDLLTLEEIEEASRRFLAARLLKDGKSIRAIAKEIGVSTTTVVRINYWLHHGTGGYDVAFPKLK